MKLFYIFFFTLFLGCGNCKNPQSTAKEETPPPSSPSKQKQKSNVVVVLLHEMGMPGNLEPLRAKLAHSLSMDYTEIKVIAPIRPGETSYNDSLDK